MRPPRASCAAVSCGSRVSSAAAPFVCTPAPIFTSSPRAAPPSCDFGSTISASCALVAAGVTALAAPARRAVTPSTTDRATMRIAIDSSRPRQRPGPGEVVSKLAPMVDPVETPLDELMAEARAVRERARGALVTYSPKVFIPLTKLCRDVCHYCTFAQPPKRSERAFMSIDEVLDVARAGERAGC